MVRNLEVARLFYKLEADTKGLDAQLGVAEKKLGSLGDFIKKNPVAALTGLGAAAIAAGFELAKMAERTNKAIGIIADRVPGATNAVDDLRHAANAMAIEFGVSQERVIATMDATSKAGVKNAQELIDVSAAAIAAGEALGVSGETLVGGLDAALDIFGLAAKDATNVMAAFFAAAQGRTSVEDLQSTIEKLAGTVQDTGLDFATTLSAVAALIDQGFEPGKKVIAEFTEQLKSGGVEAIKELATQAPLTADAMALFAQRVKESTNDIENDSQRIRSQFTAMLTELGDKLIPIATLAGKAIGALLGGGWTAASKAAAEAKKEHEDAGKVLDRLGTTGGIAAGAVGKLAATLVEAKNASADLGSKSTADLNRYKTALEAAVEAGTADKETKAALAKVNKELADRQEDATKAAEKQAAAQKKLREEFSGRAIKDLDTYVASFKRLQKATADATVTLADDLTLAIQDLRNEFKGGAVGLAEFNFKLDELNDQLELVKLNERLDLPNILRKSADALSDFDLTRLNQARVALEALYRNTIAGSKARKEIDEQIVAINDKIIDRNAIQITQYGKIAAKKIEGKNTDEETNETLEVTIGKVANIATGAIGVAEAFGLVDSNAAKVLGQIVAIGAALPKAFSGDPSAIIAVIGGLAGVISSLFSGEGPEERARKELIRKNNEVLKELVKVNGDLLRVNQPGAKLAGVQAALTERFSRAPGEGFSLPVILRELGLTMKDLDDVAKDLGITIRNPETGGLETEGLRALLKALQNLDTGFADDFQGMLDRIQTFIEAGLLDPAQEFAAIMEAATGQAPAIAKALEGINPFTAEGRTGAIAALQDLLLDFAGNRLDKSTLGNLSGTEFVDAITQLIQFLSGEGDLKPLNGTEIPGVTPDRPPLELSPDAETSDYYSGSLDKQDEGNALLTETVSIGERQLDTLDAILDALTTASPLRAPALPDSVLRPELAAVGALSAALNFAPGSIVVQGVSDPHAAAEELAETIWRITDQRLADRFRDEKRIRGLA